MRIGVVGGGVAGLYAAWHLARKHDVALLERHGRIGGHTDTHRVVPDKDAPAVAVDTGFIVFNPPHYPLFSRWLAHLGVDSQVSDMSFGVHCRVTGLEYNATDLNGLFCQRRNLVRPRFLAMVRDILRFYRDAPRWLETLDDSTTLGEWLAQSGMSEAFARDHLVPMAAALWSSPGARILEFPMKSMLEFMRNHNMLQASDRPEWRTIRGGSHRYVEAALAAFQGSVRTRCRVRRIARLGSGAIRVLSDDDSMEFDAVVLACHADQALEMLDRPTPSERAVLGAFRYQHNDTVLHTDSARMPRHPRAWAAWNVRRDSNAPEQAGISYWMNRLQRLPTATPLIVSLNQTEAIDPARILVQRSYRHPIFTPETRAAQQRLPEISGADRIWYCGAGWGWGFHEDAVRSARRVVAGIERQGWSNAA
jgi:hypothetical protein